jgi:hypothetical protein
MYKAITNTMINTYIKWYKPINIVLSLLIVIYCGVYIIKSPDEEKTHE